MTAEREGLAELEVLLYEHQAASDQTLRLSGHSGIGIRALRDRADRLEAP